MENKFDELIAGQTERWVALSKVVRNFRLAIDLSCLTVLLWHVPSFPWNQREYCYRNGYKSGL